MLDLEKARKKFQEILETQNAEAIRDWKFRNEQRKLLKSLLKGEVCEKLEAPTSHKQYVKLPDSNHAGFGWSGEYNYAMAA